MHEQIYNQERIDMVHRTLVQYGVALTPQDPKYSPFMGEIIIESTQKDHLLAALDTVFNDSSPG